MPALASAPGTRTMRPARPLLAAAALAWLSLASGSPARAETLHDALGGQPGLVRIVDALVRHTLADDRIKHTFDDTNIARFKGLLVTQLCELSGGPCQYRGRDMRKAHSDLRLTSAHFNALVEDLQSAMDECGVPFRTQNRLLALLAPMHPDTVAK